MVVGDIAVGTQVAVIGAGPGGYVAAIRAAQLGKDVTLIEKDSDGLGGICLNKGCIPSKALIYAANIYDLRNKYEKMGITFGNVSVDFARMQAWKAANIVQLRNGIGMLMKKNGVTVITGEASFESSRKLKVVGPGGTQYIQFERAIIATGSRPIELPGLETNGVDILNSNHVFDVQQVPKSVIVIGGGYIALELGTVFAKLGAKVTMIEKYSLLGHMDRDLIVPVIEKTKKLGIDIYEGVSPLRITRENGQVIVHGSHAEKGEMKFVAEKVLVAVGRQPNTEHLGLEKTQVQLDEKKFIKVDAKRKTTDPYIYAVGDITPGPMLAHKGFAEGKVAAEAIAGKPAAYEPQAVPVVFFADPEIASSGLTETEAAKKGYKVKVSRFPLTALGRAVSIGKSEGFVKVVSEEGTERILGMHFVAENASEMVGEVTLGIEMGFRLEDLAMSIHPHPTFSEALMEAAEVALGKSVHVWQPKK